jgi:acyl dehydratase
MPRYLQDLEIGETWTSGPIRVTLEDIIGFAGQYDPQPMHTDPETAARSRFGTLIASGLHVVALAMRAFIQSGGYGGDTPAIGLGVDELRWRKPVRPGDVLTVKREVIALDRSKSRPGVGTVRTRVTVTNQDEDVVLSMVSLGQLQSRPDAGD